MKTKTDHLLYLLLSTPMTLGTLIDTARVCPTTAENSLKRLRDAGLIAVLIENGRPVYYVAAGVR